MPIKLPLGLKSRRKSSAQVLEEAQNPPQSSFRVLERGHSKSFDGFNGGRRMISEAGRPLTYHPTDLGKHESDPISENVDTRYEMRRSSTQPVLIDGRRRSGATADSSSTGPANNSAASSMRLSAASTVPSSTDLPLDNSRQPYGRKPLPEPPVASRPLATATRPGVSARGSSYGLRSMTPTYTDAFASIPQRREFSGTPSSASTATPPRLLESEFTADMDDFGNMFDALNKTKNQDAVSGPLARPPAANVSDGLNSRRAAPSPIDIDRSTDVEPSPLSWTSNDGLMSGSSPISRTSPVLERTPQPRKWGPSSWQHGSTLGSSASKSESSIRRTPSPLKEVSNLENQGSYKAWNNFRDPATARSPSPPKQAHLGVGTAPTINISNGEKSLAGIGEGGGMEEAMFDTSLVASARLAADYESREPHKEPPKLSTKVMTPAQFERYRQEQESHENVGLTADQSDTDSQDSEDEDEAERTRQATKQRRKQEAHLSVYRQQMMRVTGEKLEAPAVSITRPAPSRASTSLPNLSNRLSTMNLAPGKSPTSGPSSEDEDEDVPLGILAAHGFPNKNKAPSRLSSFRPKSTLSLRSESQPNLAGPASMTGDPRPRGPLPEFARKLPKDPYYGAGLVNPSTRESFAMGAGAQARGLTPPGLPPGGLIGVIAGEERARAIRRGSPGAQEMPHMQQMQPGMMPYAMPPMISASEQAQLQMQAQMNQMMQMQMQWMQWMMQTQGSAPAMPMGPMVPDQMSPFMQPNMSTPSFPFPGQPQTPQGGPPLAAPPEPRTMSMVNPHVSPWSRPVSNYIGGGLGHQPYAASIAPSERSNVGLASRYRPVSYAPSVNQKRSSTFTSSTQNPWNSGTHPLRAPLGVSTVRPVPEDDEDEQAWAEMKRKRDEKKSARRNKKDQQDLASLYPSGM